ncbi:hypothetical protein [Rhizobium grahamii]|uniref:Uncharacterized protein n=1 Tax=Rhizobium grahamii CCGE 502 TaxID=990285 RepID=S3HI26_9HYPH|nr:hypothetical protein [Rhizobium grahamii]EPE98444.1 hypothetical protein RGCCGE502_08455 [Rhizobium grahamii CCGE 502]
MSISLLSPSVFRQRALLERAAVEIFAAPVNKRERVRSEFRVGILSNNIRYGLTRSIAYQDVDEALRYIDARVALYKEASACIISREEMRHHA